MEYSLAMTFITASGDKTTLTVTGVRSNITQPEISALMDTIIAKNVFITKTGALTGKYGAQLTERQVTQFTV